MGLTQNSYITANDFNILKSSIANEVLRRAKKTNFPTNGETNILGNDNNQDAFISETNIPDQNSNNIITEEYFQKILDFFKKFYYDNPTTYPEGIHIKYTEDENVDIGDIIYAINKLSTYLSTLKVTSESSTARIQNNDCRGNCMGLCTGCSGTCSTSCTGTCSNDCARGCANDCTAACANDCTNVCYNNCYNTCLYSCTESCRPDGCWSTCYQDCTSGCTNRCGDSCNKGCALSCANDCTDGCSGTCYTRCSNTCQGTCSSACQDSCFTGNRLQ